MACWPLPDKAVLVPWFQPVEHMVHDARRVRVMEFDVTLLIRVGTKPVAGVDPGGPHRAKCDTQSCMSGRVSRRHRQVGRTIAGRVRHSVLELNRVHLPGIEIVREAHQGDVRSTGAGHHMLKRPAGHDLETDSICVGAVPVDHRNVTNAINECTDNAPLNPLGRAKRTAIEPCTNLNIHGFVPTLSSHQPRRAYRMYNQHAHSGSSGKLNQGNNQRQERTAKGGAQCAAERVEHENTKSEDRLSSCGQVSESSQEGPESPISNVLPIHRFTPSIAKHPSASAEG